MQLKHFTIVFFAIILVDCTQVFANPELSEFNFALGFSESSVSSERFIQLEFPFYSDSKSVSVFSNFRSMDIDNLIEGSRGIFVKTHSYKFSSGVIWIDEKATVQPFLGGSVSFLAADYRLLSEPSWGGSIHIGLNNSLDLHKYMRVQYSINEGFKNAKEVYGMPNIFNSNSFDVLYVISI